jgi:hypothetical protein
MSNCCTTKHRRSGHLLGQQRQENSVDACTKPLNGNAMTLIRGTYECKSTIVASFIVDRHSDHPLSMTSRCKRDPRHRNWKVQNVQMKDETAQLGEKRVTEPQQPVWCRMHNPLSAQATLNKFMSRITRFFNLHRF